MHGALDLVPADDPVAATPSPAGEAGSDIAGGAKTSATISCGRGRAVCLPDLRVSKTLGGASFTWAPGLITNAVGPRIG
jgi:hypothetical protein